MSIARSLFALLLAPLAALHADESKSSAPSRDDAAWLRQKDTLIFQDTFDRQLDGNGIKALGNGWESATADRAPNVKQADLDQGILKIASDGKAAGHGVHIHHDAGFADGGTTLRFRFPGINKGETLTVGHVDRDMKGVHAGHLCYAILSPTSILLRDNKTGISDEKLRARRAVFLERKEKLPADLDALLQTKEKAVPWKADNEWHDLTLAFEGDEMRLSIDGKLVASHRSEGFAHPSKRWLSLSAANTVWIDDAKIFKVATTQQVIAKQQHHWAFFKGKAGAGAGRHIVFITGDDEYKSEESTPMMAHILAERHGFDCTVLFAINKETGVIDTNQKDNIPGLDALGSAQLMVMFTRFRALPDEQMKFIDDYLQSGKPVIGLRTATHAFSFPKDSATKYASYHFNDASGGFGRQVLGQTWVNHWGMHGKQSTRGVFAPGAASHPILRGIADGEIWGPTDVYEATLPLPEGCTPLLLGQVLQGMKPDDAPVVGEQMNGKWKKMVKVNDPMMPVAWTWQRPVGVKGRVFTSTIGGAMAGGSDFANEGMRRMFVNACLWALGLENSIPATADVNPVSATNPFKRGVKPSEVLP